MAVKKTESKSKSKTSNEVKTDIEKIDVSIENEKELELEKLRKELEEIKKLAFAKSELTNKVEPDKKDTKNVSKKSVNKKELRQRAKEIEVEVLNMTNGEFFYKCKKTLEELSLAEKGDSDVVSLDFLLTMKNQHRSLLERLDLVVVDCYGDYELSDVLDYLGLNKIYEYENLDIDFIDNAINNMDSSEFEDLVNNSNIGLVVKIAERGIQLAKENKFDSNFKRSVLARRFGKDDLFDI